MLEDLLAWAERNMLKVVVVAYGTALLVFVIISVL